MPSFNVLLGLLSVAHNLAFLSAHYLLHLLLDRSSHPDVNERFKDIHFLGLSDVGIDLLQMTVLSHYVLHLFIDVKCGLPSHMNHFE